MIPSLLHTNVQEETAVE